MFFCTHKWEKTNEEEITTGWYHWPFIPRGGAVANPPSTFSYFISTLYVCTKCKKAKIIKTHKRHESDTSLDEWAKRANFPSKRK